MDARNYPMKGANEIFNFICALFVLALSVDKLRTCFVFDIQTILAVIVGMGALCVVGSAFINIVLKILRRKIK